MPTVANPVRSLHEQSLVRNTGRNRLLGSVAEQLAIQILSGELQVGFVFPTEIEFAADIGISRSALREAFRVLAAKGLVESRPKVGTRVSAREYWSLLDPDVLAWQFKSEPTAKFIDDLFEMRSMVEPAAARLAAARRTEADVVAMQTALDAMAHFGLADPQGRLADQQFHMIMLRATDNELVSALASSIMAAIAWTTIFKQRNRTLPRDPIPDHRRLFDAIAAADPDEADEAMAALIRLALLDTQIGLLGDEGEAVGSRPEGGDRADRP